MTNSAEIAISENSEAKVSFLTWLALLLAFINVVLLHLPLTECPLGVDQGVWSTVGLSINNGSVFFRDLLHFNLPGLGFSYALALRLVSDPRIATAILNLSGCMLIMVGMFFLLRQTVSAASGAWAVLFFSVWYPTMTHYWNLTQKDFMAMWGVLIATWLVARAASGARWRKLSIYSAGISVGLATMYKPLFVISGPMLALIYTLRFMLPVGNLKQKKRQDWLNFLYDIALLVAGALTIAIPFLMYLARAGALEGLYYGVFVFAPEYASNSLPFSRMLNLMSRATYNVGLRYSMKHDIYFWVWTIVLGLGVISLVKKNYGNEKYWLVVPCLTSAFTGFIQGKSYLYHALPWQIFLIAVAGCSFAYAWHLVYRSRFLIQLACISILSLVLIIWTKTVFSNSRFANAELLLWQNKISREEYMAKFYKRVYGTFPHEIEILAQWIKKNSLPTDKILAWGLECQLYSLSERMHATHSPFNLMLIYDLTGNTMANAWQAKIRHQFVQQLAAEKPKFIIIVNNDSGPMPSNLAVAVIPGFQAIIDDRYGKVESIGPFDVYQLQTSGESNSRDN
ncbi:MAG: hypothetical protein ACD_39C00875G0003 [uncultured bacterium]|nr:MAG: hypothetical protein ACD_39C00875G0003 [uncultured bacterium]